MVYKVATPVVKFDLVLPPQGIPTPRQIPPGQFPPVGAPRGPAPAQPPGAAGAAAAASFQMQGGAGPVLMDSLAIPELGPRGMYQPTPPTALVSQTPRPEDAALGRLAPAEQQRLQNERQLATQLESDVFQVGWLGFGCGGKVLLGCDVFGRVGSRSAASGAACQSKAVLI